MQATATLIVILLLVLVLAFYGARLMAKRAVRNVVLLLREHGAVTPETARTLEEVGIIRGNMMDRMFKLRDYRPQALRALVQASVVRATEDQRFYLSEDDLQRSPLKSMVRDRSSGN